jgi:hypothetical protein
MDKAPTNDGFFSRQMKRTVKNSKGGSGSALPPKSGPKAMSRTGGSSKSGGGKSVLPPNAGSGMAPRGGPGVKISHGHIQTNRS